MVGTTTTAGVTGVGGVLLTTLMGSGMLGNAPLEIDEIDLPTHSVNVDRSILSLWVTEQIETFESEPLDSECTFFNFSRRYEAEFCDAFTISRMQPGTMRVAAERALRCAAKASTECVLSPEIGLAIPAAFLAAPEIESGVKTYIAPRVLPMPSNVNVSQQHVRVSIPSDVFSTRTVSMNDTLNIEYMTSEKQVQTQIIRGDDAYCVNLLRMAYESACWQRLDG